MRDEIDKRLKIVQDSLAAGLKKADDSFKREAVRVETEDGGVGVYVSKAPKKIVEDEEEKEETIKFTNSKTKIVIPPIKTDSSKVAKVMRMCGDW